MSDLGQKVLLDPSLFWTALGTYESRRIQLDWWQVCYLRDHSRFRATEKAPQIGFSWLLAAEALWEALLFENTTTAFVSVDLDEAKNKILYARKLYEGLPAHVQSWVPLTTDSTEKLSLGHAAAPSRLLSKPNSSGLRGIAGHVVIDESDFYKDGGDSTFRVALGRMTRGYRVSIGSTVWGVDTKLDRVMQGETRNFSRSVLPYLVAENETSKMSIEIAREESSVEDFDEEYGCIRGGGAADTFSPELIRTSTHDERPFELEDLPVHGTEIMAYDVGEQHPSIQIVIQRDSDGVWRERHLSEIRGMTLPDQTERLRKALKLRPTIVLIIDAQGIGLHSAEQLRAEFGSRVLFMKAGSTGQDRVEMIKELRRALEARELELVADREQATQLRGTRLITGGKIEQRGSKRKSHYDRFWTVAYAWWAASSGAQTSVYERHGLVALGG